MLLPECLFIVRAMKHVASASISEQSTISDFRPMGCSSEKKKALWTLRLSKKLGVAVYPSDTLLAVARRRGKRNEGSSDARRTGDPG